MTSSSDPTTTADTSHLAAQAASAAVQANGAAKPQARDGQQTRFAQSFAQAIGVLMRDRQFRNMRLADLEWLVMPPLMTGQIRMAHAPSGRDNFYLPVALALWARVSPEVDKRLSDDLDKPILLEPAEWTSGDQLWLVAIAGDANAKATFLKRLQEGDFKDKTVKMRARDADNRIVVTTLGHSGEVVDP